MSLKFTSVPSKTLSESITAASTSFKVNNIEGWDGVALTSADFGTVAYGVFRNATNSILELFEFDPTTIASTSITITRRGLKFTGDLTTEVTANKLSWTKGDTYVDLGVDSPQVLQSIREELTVTYTTIELGALNDTTLTRLSPGVMGVEGVAVPTISSTDTLTNKRVTKRVGSTTSSATPTINTDNVDAYHLTAQAVDITSFTTNLSGTPTNFQQLRISVTGTAARAITWGASFANGTTELPTTTITTTRLDVLFEYDTVTSKWRCMASGSTV